MLANFTRRGISIISTEEDFLLAGVSNMNVIKDSLELTASRRQIDVTDAEIIEIIIEAISNVAKGKKTTGFLGSY